MKKIILLSIVSCFLISISHAQNKNLSKQEIRQDLEFLRNTLNEKSSYVYLNGYDFNDDFESYLNTVDDSAHIEDFGLFLTE